MLRLIENAKNWCLKLNKLKQQSEITVNLSKVLYLKA